MFCLLLTEVLAAVTINICILAYCEQKLAKYVTTGCNCQKLLH